MKRRVWYVEDIHSQVSAYIKAYKNKPINSATCKVMEIQDGEVLFSSKQLYNAWNAVMMKVGTGPANDSVLFLKLVEELKKNECLPKSS